MTLNPLVNLTPNKPRFSASGRLAQRGLPSRQVY